MRDLEKCVRPLSVAGLCLAFVGCGGEDPPPLPESTTTHGSASQDGATTSGDGTTGTSSAEATTGASAGGTGSAPVQIVDIGDEGCAVVTIRANRARPDVLIVMDASGSMAGLNESNAVRWDPAVSAVNTVVGQLERDIQFGLMTFPAEARGCDPGQLDVPLAPMNAAPIAQALAGINPGSGSTPTSHTLAEAERVLAQRDPVLVGEFPLPQYIMLVTDGDPNCVDVRGGFNGQDLVTGLLGGFLGGGGGTPMDAGAEAGTNTNPGGVQPDPAAQQASVSKIQELSGKNVLTYVIGYDTMGTSFAPVLDQMAVAGGTGDTAHRSVSSGDDLVEEFRSITAGTVSCSFVLTQPVPVRRVKIWIDGEESKFGEDWQLQDDGQTVDLLGSACDALQIGATVEAEVVCEEINLL